jgi:hypothetical protein
MSVEMPAREPEPKSPLKSSFVEGTAWRPVSRCASPITRPIMPSVTRKEGSRSLVTRRPLMSPTRMPVASPAAMPATSPLSRSCVAATRDESATVEPMDRSISPVLRTNTVPTAITVIGAVCRRMLVRFCWVKKPSSLSATDSTSRISRNPAYTT